MMAKIMAYPESKISQENSLNWAWITRRDMDRSSYSYYNFIRNLGIYKDPTIYAKGHPKFIVHIKPEGRIYLYIKG